MNMRCWNCGNDQEVVLDEPRIQMKEQIVQRLQSLADLYANTGFPFRAEVVTDMVTFVRSIRP
jgi:hypothetical protein